MTVRSPVGSRPSKAASTSPADAPAATYVLRTARYCKTVMFDAKSYTGIICRIVSGILSVRLEIAAACDQYAARQRSAVNTRSDFGGTEQSITVCKIRPFHGQDDKMFRCGQGKRVLRTKMFMFATVGVRQTFEKEERLARLGREASETRKRG